MCLWLLINSFGSFYYISAWLKYNCGSVYRFCLIDCDFYLCVRAAGTDNSDQARDFSLKLKDRFYLQPLSPTEAAARAKESAKEIINVKSLIDKKAWPYVQNDLRLRASYLRYDLNTVISAKPKEEKQSLKELTGKLFQTIDNVSYYLGFCFLRVSWLRSKSYLLWLD